MKDINFCTGNKMVSHNICKIIQIEKSWEYNIGFRLQYVFQINQKIVLSCIIYRQNMVYSTYRIGNYKFVHDFLFIWCEISHAYWLHPLGNVVATPLPVHVPKRVDAQ